MFKTKQETKKANLIYLFRVTGLENIEMNKILASERNFIVNIVIIEVKFWILR